MITKQFRLFGALCGGILATGCAGNIQIPRPAANNPGNPDAGKTYDINTPGIPKSVLASGPAAPENSIPMVGAQGQYSYTAMSGMFTIVKVRDNLASYDEDPGWYRHPKGTVAYEASADHLRRDGIKVADQKPAMPKSGGGHQHG